MSEPINIKEVNSTGYYRLDDVDKTLVYIILEDELIVDVRNQKLTSFWVFNKENPVCFVTPVNR